jgi:hypothetical protein
VDIKAIGVREDPVDDVEDIFEGVWEGEFGRFGIVGIDDEAIGGVRDELTQFGVCTKAGENEAAAVEVDVDGDRGWSPVGGSGRPDERFVDEEGDCPRGSRRDELRCIRGSNGLAPGHKTDSVPAWVDDTTNGERDTEQTGDRLQYKILEQRHPVENTAAAG